MKEITCKTLYLNGFEDANDPKAQVYLIGLTEAYQAFINNKLFIRFNDGDRKGSIAKFTPSAKYNWPSPPQIVYRRSLYDNCHYRFENSVFRGTCTWSGRRNKIEFTAPTYYDDVTFLIGDEVETVWQVFDKKAAKEEALANPNQHDIDGNLLTIGDSVMYVSLRYGDRTRLQRGVITQFKASANSSTVSYKTVITNSENDLDIIELQYPEDMVWKIKY